MSKREFTKKEIKILSTNQHGKTVWQRNTAKEWLRKEDLLLKQLDDLPKHYYK